MLELIIGFLFSLSQISMSVLQVTAVIAMPRVKTPLDRIHVLVLMATLEMESIAVVRKALISQTLNKASHILVQNNFTRTL